MHASATTDAPAATEADTIAVGVFDDEGIAHDLEGAPLAALLDAGEARTSFKHLALHHADGRRWLLVGLGARDALRRRARAGRRGRGPRPRPRARHAHAVLGAAPPRRPTTWPPRWSRARSSPATASTATARAPERRAAARARRARRLAPTTTSPTPSQRGAVGADAQNFARELQDTPANDLTPTRAGRARAGDRGRRGRGPRARMDGRAGHGRASSRSPRAPTTSPR